MLNEKVEPTTTDAERGSAWVRQSDNLGKGIIEHFVHVDSDGKPKGTERWKIGGSKE